jgi:Flp pilus assembly protein TadD
MTSCQCSGVRWAAAAMVVVGVAGCSTSALDSIASAMAVRAQAERAQERTELQAQANTQLSSAEASLSFGSEVAYLQVITQLQAQQLWFASLAHLDAMERQWSPSARSQRLRADAMRQVGMLQASRLLYQHLIHGNEAGKALHGLGLLAAQERNFDEAISHLHAARAILPTDAALLSDLGFAMLHSAHAIDAGLPLLQAAQLQPSNARIQGNVALYLVLYGQPGAASAWMQQHQMSEAQRMKIFAQAQQFPIEPASAMPHADPTLVSHTAPSFSPSIHNSFTKGVQP